MAVVRSPDFLRALIRETALATLIHQRRLTPSCGGQAPTAERTVGPARMIAESLTPKPGIREHNLSKADLRTAAKTVTRSPRRREREELGARALGGVAYGSSVGENLAHPGIPITSQRAAGACGRSGTAARCGTSPRCQSSL